MTLKSNISAFRNTSAKNSMMGMNACKLATYENRFIHIQIDTTDNHQFLILCTNSSPADPARHPEKYALEHGLRLGNIQRIVDRNHGLVSY